MAQARGMLMGGNGLGDGFYFGRSDTKQASCAIKTGVSSY
jgi:hypothetical protein